MRTATGTVIPQDGEYRKKVAEYLAPDFKQALQYLAGIDQPRMENVVLLWTFSHRWGRAFPTRDTVLSTPSIYMEEYGIGACGDAFHSPPASPLESAWLSGRHLGNQILKQVL
jgi:predicted NAD/FAD-dependent oxidoreductase